MNLKYELQTRKRFKNFKTISQFLLTQAAFDLLRFIKKVMSSIV